MYRVVIKQLQLSFLSVLVISLSFLTSTVLFDFFFPSFSLPFFLLFIFLFLYLPPLFIPSLSFSLSPLFSSFWTLSRCACGNFPGVIFAALLARSLTSLSSVYPRRHFSRSPSVPCHPLVGLIPHLPLFPSLSSFIFPSDFALLVSTGDPVGCRRSAASFHMHAATFSLPFPFLSHNFSRLFCPRWRWQAPFFFHGPAGKNN